MSIVLKPHNMETYKKVTDKLNESNKVAVIHPTGTGKMYIALKLLEENKEKKAIYVAPSKPILHDIKKNIFAEGMTMQDFPNLKRITYQKLARLTDEEIENLGAEIIVLDEFHHCGAPEWGKGVDRLLQSNEKAVVLGLSATPLRYTDGLRNMADELFENNVASEMTLEEAIETGILPKASYVSTLYGYDKALEDMQENIDIMQDEAKKREAQELLDSLRDKLDENTQNLQELFLEYMKNKNGKYIVFCKNIEDMNDKMKQAQKMFGGVNSNITIRSVSSKIKESDKILTEFEEDNDEETLKLLYAVDMLNEGYHVKDIDGVVMMRPTFSPTIYTQQLGRALTVGENKSPVVLDLVNNFDSCKIIEDFAERMRKYKGKEGKEKTEINSKRRLSIFDKTKEFREIAERITELSKERKVSLEHKIEIFEKFAQTGEMLNGNTIFEGYPIGKWAIQIRNTLNRMNDNKEDRRVINLSEEQFEKLRSMGILEKQIDSTIDEKIDSLVEWRKKYPDATIIPNIGANVLKQYAKTDEEYRYIKDEYDKVRKYYRYIASRKCVGKLSEEQLLKCKEANIGGVFGKKLNEEDNELIDKYGLDEKAINLIRKKYGSIDEFRQDYIKALIYNKIDLIDEKILNSVNLIKEFDLSTPDWILRNQNVMDFLKHCFNLTESPILINSEKTEELLSELLNQLTEQENIILSQKYGINGEDKITSTQIAKKIGKTLTRVGQIALRAERKLNYLSQRKNNNIGNSIYNIDFDFKKQIIEEYFKYYDVFKSNQIIDMPDDIRTKLTNMLLDGVEKTKKRNEQIRIIEEMPTEQAIKIMNERFGEIFNCSDFRCVSPDLSKSLKFLDGKKISECLGDEQIYRECLDSEFTQIEIATFIIQQTSDEELIKNGKKEEIEEFIKNNQYLSEDTRGYITELLDKKVELAPKRIRQREIEARKKIGIEKLELSYRSLNCLKRAGIVSLFDLENMTKEGLKQVRSLGEISFDEIVEKMQEHGVSLKNEEETDNKEDDKEENTEEKKTIITTLVEDILAVEEQVDDRVEEKNEKINADADDNETQKQRVIKRILEKQKIIEEQLAQIDELSNQKGAL